MSVGQDCLKCSVPGDHGSGAPFDTTSLDPPGTPPLHNEAFAAIATLDEAGRRSG